MGAALARDADTPTLGAIQARMVGWRECGREYVTSAQCLDRPDRGRNRTTDRRGAFCGFHEERLGDPAVLSDAARASRDALVALAKDGAVQYRRDLASLDAGRVGGIALHRRARDGGKSEWCVGLYRPISACPRADGSLAQPFP